MGLSDFIRASGKVCTAGFHSKDIILNLNRYDHSLKTYKGHLENFKLINSVLAQVSNDISKYVTRSRKMSRNLQILFLKYSQTKLIASFGFLLFVQSFNCLYLWNKLPNLCGVFTKLKPKQYANRKYQKPKITFFDFRLILLDHITYIPHGPTTAILYWCHCSEKMDMQIYSIWCKLYLQCHKSPFWCWY